MLHLKFEHYALHKKEVDTTICLIAQYDSAVGENKITIFTVDSDVALLKCFIAKNKKAIHVYLQIGVSNNFREVNV